MISSNQSHNLMPNHCSYLASYFGDHNLLCKSQSGFRRMHSTEPAETYFADEILMNMDKGLVTGSVFIDLAKAFDTVHHDILLSKLEYSGVCNESLPWFKNYFTGRKQSAHIDSQSSEELAKTSGVPQGSILGPCYSLPALMTYNIVSNTVL